MPLSHPQTQAAPGNSTSSRKRPHAEITRSESRSQSPQHPSKRRRTILSPFHRSSSSQDSTAVSSDGVRFTGDGFDYRRPMMSATSALPSHTQDTIDLTLEDDSPPHRSFSVALNHQSSEDLEGTEPLILNPQQVYDVPPPVVEQNSQPQHVIDLSSDEEEGDDGIPAQGEGGINLASESPEIQFIGERVVPQPAARPVQPQIRPNIAAAAPMFGAIATFLRGMNFSRAGRVGFPEDAFDRIDGLLNHPAMGRGGLDAPPDVFLDEYEGLQMDYGRTPFNLGADALILEDPNIHGQLNRANTSTYKEPPPAKDGFTRNYDEDDVLICGLCGDELATGTTEQKQQVWIVKQCGHAYCGDCAHNRTISKSKNNRDTKRQAGKKTNAFKTCNIPGCNKAVDSKTKMFQIYL